MVSLDLDNIVVGKAHHARTGTINVNFNNKISLEKLIGGGDGICGH